MLQSQRAHCRFFTIGWPAPRGPYWLVARARATRHGPLSAVWFLILTSMSALARPSHLLATCAKKCRALFENAYFRCRPSWDAADVLTRDCTSALLHFNSKRAHSRLRPRCCPKLCRISTLSLCSKQAYSRILGYILDNTSVSFHNLFAFH